MVEVFKTNVEQITQAKYLIEILRKQFPKYSINFDLNDCDKIIRLEGENINKKGVIALLNQNSFTCEELPDAPALFVGQKQIFQR